MLFNHICDLLQPPFLRPGDTVGVVAPASRFSYDELTTGLRILRDDWQLRVIEGESLRAADGPFAGSDDLRRADLQRMFDNPTVRAVFAARGGYGCYRIVDDLDLTGLHRSPKWLVGFSDITVLLSRLYKQGIQSLHGIMPRQFGNEGMGESIDSLRQWLFGNGPNEYTVPTHPLNRHGLASGRLVGGNLTMLCNSVGTPTDVEPEGAILFIEDIDETLFSLDRMMQQLRRSGRLARLAGLVVGQFTDMRINASLPFDQDAFAIIADALSDVSYPVLFNFPAGHVDVNLALPIGRAVTLDVTTDLARLTFD